MLAFNRVAKAGAGEYQACDVQAVTGSPISPGMEIEHAPGSAGALARGLSTGCKRETLAEKSKKPVQYSKRSDSMSEEGVFNEAALEDLVIKVQEARMNTPEADICGALNALVIRLGGDVTILAAEIEQAKRIMPDFLDHDDGKGVRIIIPTKAKAQ